MDVEPRLLRRCTRRNTAQRAVFYHYWGLQRFKKKSKLETSPLFWHIIPLST